MMWKVFKAILGAGLALIVLGVIVVAVVIPMVTDPDPSGALDDAGKQVAFWFLSPGFGFTDPKIVVLAFFGFLVWLFLFALGKLKKTAKAAFGKAEKPKPKKKKYVAIDDDDDH